MAAEETRTAMVQELAESGGDPPPRYIVRENHLPIEVDPPPWPVPVVDLGRLFQKNGDEEEAMKLESALKSHGLVQVVGHDISSSFLDEVRHVVKEFLQLPMEVKQKYSNLVGGVFDYQGYGNDCVISQDQVLDWTDRLYLLVQPEHQQNLKYWPENPSSFREIIQEYTIKTRQVANQFLRAIANILKLDEDYFVNLFSDTASVFARFNYFPPCSRPDVVLGIKPHTDTSTCTVVLPDKEVETLQLLKDGQWVKVTTVPQGLLINLGDQMEIMSNGILKGPLHRVVTNSHRDRLSIAMFFGVDPDTEIEPADALVSADELRLYKKVKVKDYIDVFFQNYHQGKRSIEWAMV